SNPDCFRITSRGSLLNPTESSYSVIPSVGNIEAVPIPKCSISSYHLVVNTSTTMVQFSMLSQVTLVKQH
ncbi:hypothetical protein J6590_087671, partial [Homalodisca vitripennis]